MIGGILGAHARRRDAELARLERQRDDAADRLDALLHQRELAMEGHGIGPSPAVVDMAWAALEVAEGILTTYCRTGGVGER